MSENLNFSKGGTVGWCYGEGQDLGTAGADLPGCDSPNGRVYTWEIAMDGNSLQGLCPDGWHIPSVTEWQAIGGYNIMSSEFYVRSGNYNKNSSYPPLGWKERNSTGNGFYWTSNNNNYFAMMMNNVQIGSDATSNDYFSVRCVADETLNLKADCNGNEYYPLTQKCLTINIIPAIGGTVSIEPNSDSVIYDHGTEITLTAMPAEGYIGVDWRRDNDDYHGYNVPMKITMNTNWTINANFK